MENQMSIARERQKMLIDDLRVNTEQASGRLRKRHDDFSEGYCCLGRACEIFKQMTGQGKWELLSYDNCYSFKVEFDRETGDANSAVMPYPVSEWFGFGEDSDPSFNIINRQGANQLMSLAALNDSGFTFDQIADCIEYFLLEPEPVSNA